MVARALSHGDIHSHTDATLTRCWSTLAREPHHIPILALLTYVIIKVTGKETLYHNQWLDDTRAHWVSSTLLRARSRGLSTNLHDLTQLLVLLLGLLHKHKQLSMQSSSVSTNIETAMAFEAPWCPTYTREAQSTHDAEAYSS